MSYEEMRLSMRPKVCMCGCMCLQVEIDKIRLFNLYRRKS